MDQVSPGLEPASGSEPEFWPNIIRIRRFDSGFVLSENCRKNKKRTAAAANNKFKYEIKWTQYYMYFTEK